MAYILLEITTAMATYVYSTAKPPLTALLERADITHPIQTVVTLPHPCGKFRFSSSFRGGVGAEKAVARSIESSRKV